MDNKVKEVERLTLLCFKKLYDNLIYDDQVKFSENILNAYSFYFNGDLFCHKGKMLFVKAKSKKEAIIKIALTDEFTEMNISYNNMFSTGTDVYNCGVCRISGQSCLHYNRDTFSHTLLDISKEDKIKLVETMSENGSDIQIQKIKFI